MNAKVPLFCVIVLMILLNGCGKKAIEPGVSDTIKPEGYTIERSQTQEIADGGSLGAGDPEPLDTTGYNPLAPDTTSRAYQDTYGRSTAPLLPVYFDFDSSSINTDQLDNLNSSGAHLLTSNFERLVIEGNCDARGTADYNLALGELRAINVKKYLVNIGVAGERIKTVSYGSQRPLFLGNDEQSWAGNRRADLVLP